MLFKVEKLAGNPNLFEPFLHTIIENKPAAIWLAFGKDIKVAVDRIREIEKLVEVEKEEERRRNVIFVMVQNTKQGIEAANWDIDVVVAQGQYSICAHYLHCIKLTKFNPLLLLIALPNLRRRFKFISSSSHLTSMQSKGTESGGHGPSNSTGLPLISLLPLLHSHYKTLPTPPILLAAGGISTGLQLLSVLPFTSGSIIGTGFLCTPESLYSPAQKELLIRSEGEETVRTERFDVARGSLAGWGEGVDGRGIGNKTSWEDGRDESELVKDYGEGAKVGDVERIVTWAG